jgi:transposase
MARTASGIEVLKQAKALVLQAKTADQLRQAQAVLLPLEFGLSLKQTAQAIGVSVGWTCQLRRRFIRRGGKAEAHRARMGGRHRENMTREAEAEFLEPFFEKAKTGGILVVSEIKRALDKRLGREVPLASAYNLLHRHGWRKSAPVKRRAKADVPAWEEWKNNSPASYAKSSARGRAKGRSG